MARMKAMIGNEGYDACIQRNTSNIRIKGDKTQNPELRDTYELIHAEPVAPEKPVPDVILDFAKAAQRCGLGSISKKGNILTPQFGPYARFAFMITDAPLECDEAFRMLYRDAISQNSLVDKTYRHFYPFFSLSLPVKNVEMGLSMTTKVKRPSYYELRNSEEYFNRYSIEAGNPWLLPQYTTDISYSLQWYQFRLQ